MLLIDDLLLGGLRFVLDKLATVVDQELNDEPRLHQTLMEAQMRFEMGEIDAAEFADVERMVIDRLREIRAEREAGAPALTDEGVRISSVEVSGPDAELDVEMPANDIEASAMAPRAVSSVAAATAAEAAKTAKAKREAAGGDRGLGTPRPTRALRARRTRPASKTRTSPRRSGTRR